MFALLSLVLEAVAGGHYLLTALGLHCAAETAAKKFQSYPQKLFKQV